MARLIGWGVRVGTEGFTLTRGLKGLFLGKGRGQASAIGAVFFILILGIILGYLFNFISQVEDLNRAALSAVQARFERQREDLRVVLVDYVEADLVDYDPGSVEIVYGSKVSDSPLVIESTFGEGGGGVGNITLIEDNFDYPGGETPEDHGWHFNLIDELVCNGDKNATCYFDDVYESGIEGHSIGVEGFEYIATTKNKKYNDLASGYWYKTFIFPEKNVTSVHLSLSYIVKTVSFLAVGRGVRWTLTVSIYRSEGPGPVWSYELYGEWHDESGIVEGGSVSFDIDSSLFEAGKSYELRLNVEIENNVKTINENSSWVINYHGKAYFDNVRLVAYYTDGGVGCGGVGKAGATFSFSLDGGVPEGLDVSVEVNVTPVELGFFYEDSEGIWRRFDSYLLRTTGPADLEVPVSGGAQNSSSFMIIASAAESFRITLHGFRLNCSFVADNLNITVLNVAGETVKVVSIWVVNSTNVWRSDLNVVLAPLEEETVWVDYGLVRGSRYLVRIVTEKGNIFDYYLAVP